MRPPARSASAAARAVIARAAIVTRTGYPEAMPPLAPWFLTTRTVTQPNVDPSAIRPAATRDLVTWSATTTVTATPAMAHRTRRDLAAAPSGIIAMSTRLRRPPARRGGG